MTAAAPAIPAATSTPSPRWVVPWLTAVAVSVVAMIVLGGVVRLAHAGLSIVEWAPVRGILPPLSASDWAAAFDAYRASPEYRLVNEGISLAAFRHIYWLEWGHRLLGRLAGLLLVLPLAYGLVTGVFTGRARRALLGIAVLFGLQGVMGWLMVASGLVHQPWVSPYRLTLHLWLALGLLAAVLWLLLDRVAGRPAVTGGTALRPPVTAALAAVFLQTGLGALVAGHRAGWVSDTFPRMQGQWIPDTLGAGGWADVLGDPLAVHFEHRWFAFAVLATVMWLHARARTRVAPLIARRLTTVAAVLVWVQVSLGILVVLGGVPAPLASVHQAGGVLLFGVLIAVLHQAREP